MDFIRTNIHMNKRKAESTLQVTFDEDFNVPDNRPDLAYPVKTQANINLTERSVSGEKLYIGGQLQFSMLYVSEETAQTTQSDHTQNLLHTLTGQLSFTETVNLPVNSRVERPEITWSFEDITATRIHSRKINLKCLVRFLVGTEELSDLECVVAVQDEQSFVKTETLQMSGLALYTQDSVRLHESIRLPSGKRTAESLLYREIALQNPEIRLQNDRFLLKGELSVFFVYTTENDEIPYEYYETELPFSQTVNLSGCTEDMTPDIKVLLTESTLHLRPDEDGENRIFEVEGLLELQIRAFEDSTLQVVSDLYSLKKELIPSYETTAYRTILARNNSKLRISETVTPTPAPNQLLQLAHVSGSITIDDSRCSTDDIGGIDVDGVLTVSCMYVSSRDEAPLQEMTCIIPFSHHIEIRGMTDAANSCSYELTPVIEQLNVIMLDQKEAEVKASIGLTALCFQNHEIRLLTGVTEETLDSAAFSAIPGMVGHVVGAGELLWDLAKRYRTTVAQIMAINELEQEQIKPGDRLLIVKQPI